MTARLVTADTVLGFEPGTDAVLVEAGRIVAIGSAAALRRPGLIEVRHPGGTIAPGLRDAHLHPVGHAGALRRISLKSASDFGDLSARLRAAAKVLPAGTALIALRLDDESLAEGRLPDRTMLDATVPDRPVLLIRYCGHIAVANTATLEIAGIGMDTSEPVGGSIDRGENRAPTGILRETAVDLAIAAVEPLAPPIEPDDLIAGAAGLASTGLTGVGAIVSTEAGCWGAAESELDLLLEAASRIPITMTVFVSAATAEQLESAATRLHAAGGRLRFGGLKVFADGSLGGHTAVMHHGFADRPEERGTDRLDPAWCLTMSRLALRLGGGVAIHAIGDRANSGVLDVMETLIAEGADPGLLRVEHASVLTEADVARFGRLQVTASVQPAFLASETTWLEKRVGSDRLALTYPFRSLLESGAPLAGGSDCPVEPPHPLYGVAAARDRCGIVPEQGLDAASAWAMFTGGSAAAIGESAALEPGAPATFTVLPLDPLLATPDDLRQAEVQATYVGGSFAGPTPEAVAWNEPTQ